MKKILAFAILPFVCTMSLNALELSLSRAVEMIQAESQDLKKAEYNVLRARAGLEAVNSAGRAQAGLNASYLSVINMEHPGKPVTIDLSGVGGLPPGFPTHLEVPDNFGLISLSVTQPLYTFGRIKNAAEAARRVIEATSSGTVFARQEIRAAAAQIYWTAKMTDEIVKITQNNLQSSQDAQDRLTSVSRTHRPNLVKISADIAVKEIALSDARFYRDSAHRLLKIMAGIDESESLVLTDEFPHNFAGLSAPAELDDSPEWSMLQSQVRMYQAQAAARKADRNPVLGATVGYNYLMAHTEPWVWDGWSNRSANIGIALKIPLFDGGLSQAHYDMDMLLAQGAMQDLDKSKKIKSNDYRNALLNHERLLANMAKLKTARDLAGKMVQISMDRLEAGQTSAVELSEVQNALMQVDMAVVNAKFNILMAEETIKKLIGK